MKRRSSISQAQLALVVQAAIVVVTGVVIVRLIWPAPQWQPPSLDSAASGPASPLAAESPLDLAVLTRRNLRQPPVDPPAPAPAAPVPETPLAIRLIGTAVEAERSFAVFGLPDNHTLVREVGGNVEGYEVMEVKRGSARLRRGEREYEVRVPWFDRIAAESVRGEGP